MSLFTDIKFLNILSSQLPLFKKKGDHLWNCRCPVCGDSRKNKTKTRVEIYRKQNNLSFSKAVERMCSINHPQHKLFIVLAKLTKLKPKRFLNLVSMWKKLPFVKLPKKELSESYKKRQTQIRNNISKIEATNKKIAEMRRKRDSIIAARRR